MGTTASTQTWRSLAPIRHVVHKCVLVVAVGGLRQRSNTNTNNDSKLDLQLATNTCKRIGSLVLRTVLVCLPMLRAVVERLGVNKKHD